MKSNRVFIIGEIGINHNGSIENAIKLIDFAKKYDFDAVKFQKRTVDLVFSPEELNKDRETPFGKKNGDLKRGLEFGKKEYDIIDNHCKKIGIHWFASPWDLESYKFLMDYKPKYIKVASCLLTVKPLIHQIAQNNSYKTFISTGMSSIEEIDEAVNIFKNNNNNNFELMHCVSTYPCKNEEVNLNIIETLKKRYDCNIGYSGHEEGLQISVAAAALGATSIERHITLNRTMFGSDQAASISPEGMRILSRDIRTVEEAMGINKKDILESEVPIREKLSNVYWNKT
ncbi:N-acetylneuraminate synthase family protein [Pelagibacterales bacterium SAG-MED06]|nr:N-acetylneuraminate synthase family protein [Pelagibacterales bacterium SAG-MED06]